MRAREAAAFVSQGPHDCTVVLDADAEFPVSLSELAHDLSSEFVCPVLVVVVSHSDVLSYELWHAGELRDRYCSMPHYPESGSPEGGNAADLARVMGGDGCDLAAVERILRVEYANGAFLFEEERHRALAAALGLPEYAAGFGYRYLARSISAGEPLSTGFVSTGVPYEEPLQVVPFASAPFDDEADVVVDVTPDMILWRWHGEEHRIFGDPEVGAQLREARQIPVSARVQLRFIPDVKYERARDVLKSLDGAGFSELRVGGLGGVFNLSFNSSI
jgi:hypothetical protein